MKNAQYLLSKTFLSLFALVFMAVAGQAQELDKATVEQLVSSRNFTFKAQNAVPTGAVSRPLNYDYELAVMPDSLNSYLPYFGRAYQAPFPGESGIQFASSEFKYKASKRKKGGWQIKIEPEDTRNVREMDLTIYENGYAYLQVLSNYRQPISFNGYIVAAKQK